MIDIVQSTTCKACGKPIIQAPGGHRLKIYCNAACKMRDRRRKERTHQTQEARSTQVAALERRIAALEKLLDQVRDIEETFSTDTGVHSFKKWLGGHRYHAERPGCKNILDKAHGFPPGGSRGTYRDAMRRAGFSRDEQDDVWTAWRDMLKDELLKKYYANRNQ